MDKRTHPLESLTHLDGRSGEKVALLRPYFSELAWMRYRLRVMIDYLNFLAAKKIINSQKKIPPRLLTDFGILEGSRVWELEKMTNHDMRALELYLKDLLNKRFLLIFVMIILIIVATSYYLKWSKRESNS